MIFWFGDFVIWRGPLHLSAAVDCVVVMGCEVVGVGLVDFGVMILDLDSFLGAWFCFELVGLKEWTSDRKVRMVDVTDGVFGGAGVGDMSWMKSDVMPSISLLVLSLKVSSITFVMLEVS